MTKPKPTSHHFCQLQNRLIEPTNADVKISKLCFGCGVGELIDAS